MVGVWAGLWLGESLPAGPLALGCLAAAGPCFTAGWLAVKRGSLSAALWVGLLAAVAGAMRQATLLRVQLPGPEPGVEWAQLRLLDDGRARARLGPDHRTHRAWVEWTAVSPSAARRWEAGPVRLHLRRSCGREGDRIVLSVRRQSPRPAQVWGVASGAQRWRAQGIDGVWHHQDEGRCRVVRGAGALARWRRHVRDALFGETRDDGTRVVAALALGDRLPSGDARRAVADAGLAHLLVVSGFHLSLVAAAAGGALTWLVRRIPWAVERWGAARITGRLLIPILGMYTLMVGAGPSAVRASTMVVLQVLAPQLGRRADGITVFGAAITGLVWYEPRWIGQLGFQLSAAAVVGVMFVGPRLARGPLGRWPPWLAKTIAPSLGALLTTAPFVAGTFGRISWVGVVATPLVGPWVCLGLVPAAGSGALLSFFWKEGARAVWTAAEVQARWFLAAAHWVAECPGAVTELTALRATGVAVAGLTLAAGALWMNGRTWTATAGLFGICVGFAPCLERPGEPELLILPVDHGNAALLRLESGVAMLFDTGTEAAARAVVLPALRAHGVTELDLLVLSHADTDHTGGLSALRKRIPVRQLWQGPSWVPADRTLRVREDHEATFDRARLVVRSAWDGGGSDNDRSLAIELRLPGCRILLPGDLEEAGEARAVARSAVEPVDIVVVPHHGSSTSSSEVYVSRLRPRWAVISTGGRHRPAEQVLHRYRRLGIPTLRTDRIGAVRIGCGPRGPRVQTHHVGRR